MQYILLLAHIRSDKKLEEKRTYQGTHVADSMIDARFMYDYDTRVRESEAPRAEYRRFFKWNK